MILWKFTLREVKSRPGRATLTLLSIVIGVAAVVAVTVGTATTHQAYQEMYESVAGRAALEVVADGGGFFDEDVARADRASARREGRRALRSEALGALASARTTSACWRWASTRRRTRRCATTN